MQLAIVILNNLTLLKIKGLFFHHKKLTMRVSYFFSILLFTFLSITASAQTLAEAISNKDTAAAAKLILAGADVNKPDENYHRR